MGSVSSCGTLWPSARPTASRFAPLAGGPGWNSHHGQLKSGLRQGPKRPKQIGISIPYDSQPAPRGTQGYPMANNLYQNDLPDGLDLGPVVAIDCETMGLNLHRDRLCVVQLSGGDGNAHLVQVA